MKKISMLAWFSVFSVFLFADIRNPDKPLKGNWDFQIQKIWEIETAGNDTIGEVQNIVTAEDGRIYIADCKNFNIFIFSKDGKFISSFGSRGEGPGEIKKYGRGDQLFVVNDHIIFVDPGRIHYFSLEGEYRKTALIPFDLKPRAFISEDIFASAPLVLNDLNKSELNIILYNIKDKSEKIISKFLPFENGTKRKKIGNQRLTVSVKAANIIPQLMVITRNGRILYGMSDSYRINLLDLKGKENFTFGIEGRKQDHVPEKFKKDLANDLQSIPQDMAKEIIDGIPRQITCFQWISLDKKGLIYVFVSAPDDTNIQAIDIFSPGGEYLYSSRIRVEEKFSIYPDVIYHKDDFLFLILEDEEGNQKVVKYSVKLPVLR